ncbi:hypothetical protein Tco_0243120 [Tanacetum coccineum]
MRAVVLWTKNDYPALGTLCGCPYSGFKGCVVCGKETHCVRLSASSKQSYAGHRRYLPYNHPFRKKKKAFNGQQECQLALIPLTEVTTYTNEVTNIIENKWGKGKGNKLIKTSEQQEDTRGIGGKIQKQKRKITETEGSSSQVTKPYWKKFNIWYRKLKYWRHNYVPHCIDFMHVEKNVGESLVGTLLNVPGKKTKKEISLQELDKLQAELVVTLCLLEKFFPPSFFDIMIYFTVHLTREEIGQRGVYIAEETITEETIEFFSEYHKTMKTVGIPHEKHLTNENEDGEPLSAGKSSEVSGEVFQKAHLYVIHNTNELAPYIERHKQFLNTILPGKRISLLQSEHSKSFSKWLREELDKRLSIVFNTPSKNYKDTYDEVDEEFSTVIHEHNHNILPRVNKRDLGNESQDDYYRTDCEEETI